MLAIFLHWFVTTLILVYNSILNLVTGELLCNPDSQTIYPNCIRPVLTLCRELVICRPARILIPEQSVPERSADEGLQNESETGNSLLTLVFSVPGPEWRAHVPFNEAFRRSTGADASATTSNLPPAQARGGRSYSRRALARQTNETRVSTQNTRMSNAPVDSQLICWICLSRPLEVCFVPCGHFVLCIVCAERCDSCPVCQAGPPLY